MIRRTVARLSDEARLLPRYAKPPVVEVACSVQFEPLEGLHAGRLGLLWTEYRDRFPKVEQQPPLPALREQFEEAPSPFTFKLQGTFPMPRIWFLSDDGHRLVQVQREFLIVNWRKLDTVEEYPHYEVIREFFIDEIARLEEFTIREGIGPLRAVQAELTYVNHIDARESNGSRKPLSRIIRVWSSESAAEKPAAGEFVGATLPDFEEATIAAHYILRDEEAKPYGRLHVTIEPQRFVKDNTPLYAVTLIARGAPRSHDLDAAIAVLDEGHKAIVNGFTALTTDEMHSIWERQR